ncbi:MAG: four helix bundle protein [Candidatus Omnitrophota bacterium]|jgi:four helix bundle protein|nr:MAG: four helix bundle protein [Candidatus Omnitrophota bacterium]
MKEQKFRKLDVWNRAMDFIGEIYKVTSNFPSTEIYGLSAQLRRAAISISLNIAEGSGSGSDPEFNRFLNISLRSAYEVMCGIEVACKLDYCDKTIAEKLLNECDELSAMITGLKRKLIGSSHS